MKRAKPLRERAPTHPHDALFKWTFSQRRHAAGLLGAVLPAPVVAAVRWSTLRVEEGGFVDRALRGRRSDLVLSARMGRGHVYFHAIVEQQRTIDALMVLRMGIYMMRLWEQIVREQPGLKTVPPIVPILIHHSDAGWRAATAFQDIVAVEGPARAALLPHIPCFSLRVIDLGGGRAGDLLDGALTALGKVVLWCLSVAGNDARFEQEIGRIAGALDEVLRAPDALGALEVLLRYLLATHEEYSVRKVGGLLEEAVGPQAREAIVTELDRIERRGERKGRAEMLVELLVLRFGSVPAQVSERILAAKQSALTAWTTRVLSAPTLEDVIGDDGEPAATSGRKRVRRS